MDRFEYCETTDDSLETRNSLGAEGWELVAVTPPNGLSTRIFYFKRKVPHQSLGKKLAGEQKAARGA